MTAQELLDQFRSDMMDTVKPYFWSDEEILGYMDDAYKMFARLTGGIADFTSDLTRIDIVAGENTASMDKRILRVMECFRVSDTGTITVINETDLTFKRDNDYGLVRPIYLDTTPGTVRYMVIGAQRGVVKWIQLPEANDTAQLYVYRLPATKIERDGSNLDFEFDEVGEEHHTHFALWMRYRGYMKADADVFNGVKADEYKQAFNDYCAFAKAEWERYKHKTRVVTYGGL